MSESSSPSNSQSNRLTRSAESKTARSTTVTAARRSQAKSVSRTKPLDRKKQKPQMRLKVFWVIFTDTFTPAAVFAYKDRLKAEQKATELTAATGTTHFVQIVKRVVPE